MPLPDKFVISGSPEQIALQLPILEAMYLGFKELENRGGQTNRPPVTPDFEDWLQLTLYWQGKTLGTNKIQYVEKSIRLKGVNPHTQTIQYFQTLARATIAKFNDLTFKTGHVKCKYTNWKQGFQTWGYFESKEVGYHIIETIGDIVSKQIDKKLFKYEYILDEAEAFDPTPDKVQIAGKLLRPPQKSPIATMQCYKATILFPWIGHVEKLCGVNGYIMPNLDFLDAYDN